MYRRPVRLQPLTLNGSLRWTKVIYSYIASLILIQSQDESGDDEGKEASEESEYATDDDYEDESD